MDDAPDARAMGLLAEAKRIADAIGFTLEEADPIEREAAASLEAGRREIARMLAAADPAASPAVLAVPVWHCAGAILVLDLDDGELIADRLEVIGDRILRSAPDQPAAYSSR